MSGDDYEGHAQGPLERSALELIPALLEGTLSGVERDTAIGRIEGDDGLREVFADLMRFRADAVTYQDP
jgi:hypothetical protein